MTDWLDDVAGVEVLGLLRGELAGCVALPLQPASATVMIKRPIRAIFDPDRLLIMGRPVAMMQFSR